MPARLLAGRIKALEIKCSLFHTLGDAKSFSIGKESRNQTSPIDPVGAWLKNQSHSVCSSRPVIAVRVIATTRLFVTAVIVEWQVAVKV
jgi:hypothetical protein